MVKGVNRQIIEVNNIGSPYFDKAVFYLKPGVRILPEEISSREIQRLLPQQRTDHRSFVQKFLDNVRRLLASSR